VFRIFIIHYLYQFVIEKVLNILIFNFAVTPLAQCDITEGSMFSSVYVLKHCNTTTLYDCLVTQISEDGFFLYARRVTMTIDITTVDGFELYNKLCRRNLVSTFDFTIIKLDDVEVVLLCTISEIYVKWSEYSTVTFNK
jgi:hypothetical protein